MDPEPRAQNDADRVFVLSPGVNRFIPQWDEQVRGPLNAHKIEQYDHPPWPEVPREDFLKYCQNCKLTWLVGAAGSEAALEHPSHRACAHTSAATVRSLVVFVDGICPFEGPDGFTTSSSIGVYFGPESPHNISELFDDSLTRTNEQAKIQASLEAIRYVRQNIEPTRRDLIRNTFPQASEDSQRGIRKFRLVIATDSSDLVDGVCENIKRWSRTAGAYKNEEGHAVENSEGFVQLDHEVDALSRIGIQVMWYYVPRWHNREARRLAQASLSPPG
ncbi:hypothetical protein K449DRAFT_420718 [Hypoxylon sp. EC38]|nr:hypothetical protein K449DRAFT_420718 [Hypoxylon sp. EC38]